MSSQSGISASEGLVATFNSRSWPVLAIALSEDATEFIPDPDFMAPTSDTFETALSALKAHLTKDFPRPRFAVINSGDLYFVSFIPDSAPIRQKMLFASSKNTLVHQLGSKFPKRNVLGFTELEELDAASFQAAADSSESALTEKERELHTLDAMQNLTLSHSSASAYKRELPSMATANSTALFFEVSPDLDAVLRAGLNGKCVVMTVDTAAETLNLASKPAEVAVPELVSSVAAVSSKMPEPTPMYILYGYEAGNIAFIYSCPSNCKVKARIMYAANKQGLLTHLKSDYGVDVAQVMEVGDVDEINTHDLETSEAPAATGTMKFAKPRGPRRR